jgi:hypothetical protein
MAIIDSIPEIQNLLIEDSTYIVKMGLTGTAANNKYPTVKILINHIEVYTGTVNQHELKFITEVPDHTCYLNIELHYINKTSDDTIVINNMIVENQSVKINYIEINNLRILGHDLSNLSMANYNLTDAEKIEYNKLNAPWQCVKTDSMYNNGIWKVQFERPIITNLIKQKSTAMHIFDLPHNSVLFKLQQYFKKN